MRAKEENYYILMTKWCTVTCIQRSDIGCVCVCKCSMAKYVRSCRRCTVIRFKLIWNLQSFVIIQSNLNVKFVEFKSLCMYVCVGKWQHIQNIIQPFRSFYAFSCIQQITSLECIQILNSNSFWMNLYHYNGEKKWK